MFIFFGRKPYGIEAASQIYFGKPVEEISTAEAALLAALPKSPQNYSPYIRPDWSLSRRDHVLRRMRDKGFIGPDEYGEALNVDIPQKISGARFDSPLFCGVRPFHSEGAVRGPPLCFRPQDFLESEL